MASLFTHPPKILLPGEGQALADRVAAAQNYTDRWVPLQTPQANNQNISAAESARNKRDLSIAGGIVGGGAMVTPSTPAYGQAAAYQSAPVSIDPFEAAAGRTQRAVTHGRDPSQPRSGLADYAQNMGNQAWSDIKGIMQHPENLVGPGEIGAPLGGAIKSLSPQMLVRVLRGE